MSERLSQQAAHFHLARLQFDLDPERYLHYDILIHPRLGGTNCVTTSLPNAFRYDFLIRIPVDIIHKAARSHPLLPSSKRNLGEG